MEDFPSNRQRRELPRKEEPKTERTKEIHKVVEGEVIRRKKPLGKRLRETFLGTDHRSIGELVVQDVIIPNIRDMIYEAINQGLSRTLYPDSPASRRGLTLRPGDPRAPRNYNGISRGGPPVRRDDERQMSRRARANHDFGEIILETRPEADGVLEGLFAILDEYDVVAVSDLYEMVGISSQFTDRNYGWTDLRGSDIRRIRDGWLLDLPPTEVIK